MDTRPTILLADDDAEFTALLDEYLCGQGFAVRVAGDGQAALAAAAPEAGVEAIVLDVMMPKLDGFEVLRRLRSDGVHTPVLMLTARGEDIDRILGLEMGADDYLPKPANPRELAARLRAILRRGAGTNTEQAYTIGRLQLDAARRDVRIDDAPVDLTGLEFEVLLVLCQHAGQVVDKDTLSREALGRRLLAHDRSVDMHISNLRSKLGSGAIKTVRSRGYQLVR